MLVSIILCKHNLKVASGPRSHQPIFNLAAIFVLTLVSCVPSQHRSYGPIFINVFVLKIIILLFGIVNQRPSEVFDFGG